MMGNIRWNNLYKTGEQLYKKTERFPLPFPEIVSLMLQNELDIMNTKAGSSGD